MTPGSRIPRPPRQWWLYVLLCADGTLYTGVTIDRGRRLFQHNNTAQGAKYTRARRPVQMIAFLRQPSKSAALKAEYAFKKRTRASKLAAIQKWDKKCPNLLDIY